MIPFFKKTAACFLLFLTNCIYAQLNNITHFSLIESEEEYATMIEPEDTLFEKTTIVAFREVNPIYMLNNEISYHDFATFCKKTGRKIPKQLNGNNDLLPVVNVNYANANDYCKWLSDYYQIEFRLPTDKEWEYAATIGFSENKEDQNGVNKNIIYRNNAKNEKPNCITCTQPNLYGLYHMCGNVWEITEPSDIYANSNSMIIMGGSFFEDADHVKPNSKLEHTKGLKRADIGFRIVTSKKEYELLRLTTEIQEIFNTINDSKFPISITPKGIYKENLFIDWFNGFENFYFNEENQTAGFCCWAQDINNLGKEKESEITFTFKKEQLKYIEKIALLFSRFSFEN
ncbi:SUMF1/EgtB/PvdO family nonheme iron enzyme [Flavobacterium sp. J27]|uniref:formylglycine-generating enzyme family protein n=1 Tax=Flavobacterium sp. J27 TaxID=2060419 RepID=UPI001031DD59|nr:SUMF1/EgtB/PvdO family nonheme iron enzyme [Flavobacterium sp. J27]